MRGPKLSLGRPEIAEQIDELHRKEKTGWKKNRLLAVKLASKGEHSSNQIAELCGISRGRFFEWMKKVRNEGLEGLLSRGQSGRPEGWRKDVKQEVIEEFEKKLKAHEFTTLEEARRWLLEKHKIDVSYNRVWYWAKKLKGVLRVPRPSHSKKDPAAAAEFRDNLTEKLEELKLAPGTKAKIWVMDEARFGLHTMMRKVWSVRGLRPVVKAQTKYEWDYLYGSLEVTGGEAHFCQISRVNLECDRLYLQDLARQDPQAVHILIRDQAGFHLRDGDCRVPENVRIVDLPPYSPELNPCEQLWDLIKDDLGNRIYKTIEELRESMDGVLQRWWGDAEKVLSLIGRPWLHDQANASWKT